MKKIFLISFIAFTSIGYAQVIAELQPLNYNPSFAGDANAPRINSSVSRATSNYDGGFGESYSRLVQTYMSYDQPIEKLHAGVGIQFRYNYDLRKFDPSDNSYSYQTINKRYTSLSVTYSQKINISPNLKIIPALELGHFISRTTSPNFFIYQQLIAHPELTPSLLIKSKGFFVGGYLPITGRHHTGSYALQLGHTHAPEQNEDLRIRTLVNYSSWKLGSQRLQHVRFAAISEYKWLIIGLGTFHTLRSIEPIIGVTFKNLQATYSTGIITPSFPGLSGSIHEIGIQYIFKQKVE